MTGEIVVKRPRTTGEIEQDLADVSRLYVRGIPMAEIATAIEEKYGDDVRVTRNDISNDIVTIRQAWVNSALVEFDEHRARELAHLDTLEAAYWQAWDDSRSPKTTSRNVNGKTQEITGGQPVDLKNELNESIVEERDGNPLFLQGVERCIDKRCKILGLFSPETFRVDWRRDVEKLGWRPEDAEKLKEGATQFILRAIEEAASKEQLSGDIVDAEFQEETMEQP